LTADTVGLPANSETLLDTPTIQGALDACPAGQAVELQPGDSTNAFLIAPIRIPPGVTLLVDAGVTVFASRNPRDYDANSRHSCGAIDASGGGCVPLITINKANGAGIMGYGAIDGRGHQPMLDGASAAAMSWWDLARAAVSPLTQNCPRLLQVTSSDSVTLYKITLRNSPNFHVSLSYVTNFTAWGVKIITPYDARNTDGIDPGHSSNVTITNSYISDGDDNVAISNDSAPGSTNISVTNNHFGDGHGASIGSYTTAGVSNVLFDSLVFTGTSTNRNQAGIHIKSDASRGGLVQNITYSNICMQDVRYPIWLDPFYTANATGKLVPLYQSIALHNVHATTEGLVIIQGHDASAPTTVTLDNVQVDGIRASDMTQQYAQVKLGPDPVNFSAMLHGTGIAVTNNVSTANAPYACQASAFSPVGGELIPGPGQIAAGTPLAVSVQVFTTKAVPYATYATNRKQDPTATLALAAPTGTVTIYDGDTAVGSVTLDGSSVLSVPLADLAVGIHTLTAAYSGDGNYAATNFGNYQVEVVGQAF
jgi:polygalacturonase